MKNDPTDTPESWGRAGVFMLLWALKFYRLEYVDAGDRHLAVALADIRAAARLANRQLDAVVY